MTPTFKTLRAAIGRETWGVTCQAPDGAIYCPEFDPRSIRSAFEAATQAYNDGCAVEVSCIYRSISTGAPIAISDATLVWMRDCKIDPERSEIHAPGYGPDCDDEFQTRRDER